MRAGRIIALVVGSLLALVGAGLLLGGGGMLAAYATQRDDDGFFTTSTERFETPTAALTAEPESRRADGLPDWVADLVDATVRFEVTPVETGEPIFVGIARDADVDEFLAGVAHDEVVEIEFDPFVADMRRRAGTRDAPPPAGADIWLASASGRGTQVVDWEVEGGRHAVVVMRADGVPGVAVDVEFGIKSGIVVPIAVGLLAGGVVFLGVGVALIVIGARRSPAPPPAAAPGPALEPAVQEGAGPVPERDTPVLLTGSLDPGLSRWQWLVKWFLAIPHYVVLAFLWIAFVVLTVVAGIAILLTGRYPEAIFAFNVGVLRWTWRVVYYAFGVLGTDRYPPFTLDRDPDYPADLHIEPPGALSRGLVLVKWWLLAIPHYVVVAVITGGIWWGVDDRGDGAGLIGVLVVIAAVALLFTGRYPDGLFRFVMGLQRWTFRVVAYAALMTDRYPPLRLDQGGDEPGAPVEPPAALGAPPAVPPPPPPEGIGTPR